MAKSVLTCVLATAGICGVLFPAAGWTSAAELSAQEYTVKAAYLFNFAKFVEWPPNSLAPIEGAFVIGVVGEDPFDGALDRIIENKKLHNHPLVLRRFKRGDEVKTCHLLFISSSENDHLEEIVKAVHGASVLLVGENEKFLDRGGMINFFLESQTVKFSINLPATERAGLKLSSKLLSLAKVVKRAVSLGKKSLCIV
jgi:hypothetical protein